MKNTWILLIGMILLSSFRVPDRVETVEIMHEVFTSVKNIQSLSFDFHSRERIRGEYIESDSYVAVTRNPYRIYLKGETPIEGLEVLFPHPESANHALINPNGFPWMNLKLDPFGTLMRRDQHHTVHAGGYDYMMSIMQHTFDRHPNDITTLVKHRGFFNWNGVDCHSITLECRDFHYESYTTTQPNETISAIAEKQFLNAFLISEKNQRTDILKELKVGTTLQIPNEYARKVTLYIDKDRKVPVLMKIYDEEGLFEYYEFNNIVIDDLRNTANFGDQFEGFGF